MKLDRRITNGLAWAGVVLVIGVPAADLLSAQFSGDAAPAQVAMISPVAPTPAPLSQRPDAPVAKPAVEVAVAAPAKPAVVKPAAPAAQAATAVDSFLQSGKPLPSYITGAGAAPAPAQTAATQPVRTPIVTTPAAVDPVQVAAIPPQKVAPVPMPLSMRPEPIRVPVAVTAPGAIVIPPGIAPQQQPLPAMVNEADLADWETGPLSEFLARRQGQGGSSATVTNDYDPNGFFLDQGPNNQRRDRVIGWEEPGFSFFAD
ncbi:hypothetical protein SAMN05428969_1558 [Devosia sp. YR412]|uniref:hypothetical protein n=1 Tax=Devosia sp. YR412 TaxID=1881030 RepID=UPI0008C57229|nr:hypothetical protein [Devosia sp. YR412]SEQ01774.1 hypothetical protein SAMN05428969_1558 [Devosia sp. YR412]